MENRNGLSTKQYIRILDILCKKADLSPRQLSLILGYNENYVSRLWKKDRLDLEVLLNILKVFKIPPHIFFRQAFYKELKNNNPECINPIRTAGQDAWKEYLDKQLSTPQSN